MKAFFKLVFVLLLLAGWGLAAASLQLVRVPENAAGSKSVNIPKLGRFMLVPKTELCFKGTYVDARGWSNEDFAGADNKNLGKITVLDTKSALAPVSLEDARHVAGSH